MQVISSVGVTGMSMGVWEITVGGQWELVGAVEPISETVAS